MTNRAVSGALDEELRAVRDRLELSQEAMAAALGVPTRTYQSWEGGQAPQHPTLLRLALSALEAPAA